MVAGLIVRKDEVAPLMLVPLLVILMVLSVAVAGAAIFLQMQEREKRLAKERELTLVVDERDALKLRLGDLEQQKARTEQDLVRVKQELTQVQERLVKAAEAQETLARSVEEREKEISRLTKELEQAGSEAKRISTQMTQLQTERDTVTQQLTQLEQQRSELETKVKELSSAKSQPTVELEKVFVTDGAESFGGASALPVASASSIMSDGQIVVINREYDFIVMNLGRNHGLSIGQEFQIIRGAQVLGRVKVEKVYDELSAAAILPESQKDNIREGDVVKAL